MKDERFFIGFAKEDLKDLIEICDYVSKEATEPDLEDMAREFKHFFEMQLENAVLPSESN